MQEYNALYVRPGKDSNGKDAVLVGIYHVDPKEFENGRTPEEVKESGPFRARLLAGLVLAPKAAYGIAQRFTLAAMYVEDQGKDAVE